MTTKPRFGLCASTAIQLLLDQEIRALHTDVQALDLEQQVLFDSIENYCQITGASLFQFTRRGALSDGCTIRAGGRYLVLYNNLGRRSADRLNWTLAHEVGHICLGHTQDGTCEETEANFFASELLMPEIVIRHIASFQTVGYLDLQEMFHVSPVAAQRRICTLKKRENYWASDREVKLLQKYLPLLRRIH